MQKISVVIILEKKIISKHRYKKVTKSSKQKKARDVAKLKIETRKNNKKINDDKYKKVKKNVEGSSFGITILKIVACVAVLVLVAFISKYISKNGTNPIMSVFSPKTNNTQLVENYDLKIGINKLGNTDIRKSNNIVENELLRYSNLSLINIKDNYEIEYNVAKTITKTSDLEYEIEINKNTGVKSSDIVNVVNDIKNTGSENVYYDNVKNISNIAAMDDNKVKITLSSPDSYFVYNLNFPIYQIKEFSNFNKFYIDVINENSISFKRNDKNTKSILKSVTLTNYADGDTLVNDFRQNNIDMFLTSSYNTMQLIGKHEYNVKKYRNGEAIFLFGNKNSYLFGLKEIRQALVYGINRDEIVKNTSMSLAEVIDLPYIYSNIKYKYDTYAADNILLANGWNKYSGIYTKKIDGVNKQIELNLLVNEEDALKVNIADSLKEMIEKIGIRINIIKLKPNDLNNRISQGDYDLVLSTVYVNENPKIDYLAQYVNINDVTNDAFQSVNASETKNIAANIQNLQNILSEEVACIGILAKNTNVVYQKYITGFEDIGYMRIFKNINNIGKAQEGKQ